MATSLAAMRLQPWQQQHHQDVMVEMACGVVKVRAFGGFHHPRGRVCRVPTMTTSSRRETLTSAMSEDHDITDMQETDKVSGEWWKPILTAVHEWSQDKLLGLAELADGSLFFSFGPGSSSTDSNNASSSKTVAAASSHTEPTPAPGATIPRRHASSFRKQSPIPASRKKANELKKAAAPAPAAQPHPEKEEDHNNNNNNNNNNKPPSKEKAKTTPSHAPTTAAQPHRPPSSFFKRSPIPKNRASSPKKQSPPPAIEAPGEETVVEESLMSPELLSRGKESAKSAKVGASEASSSKKQSPPAIEAPSEETATESPIAPELSSRAKSAKVGASEAPGKKKAAASKAVKAAETVVEVVETVVEVAETVVEVAQTSSIEPPGKSLRAVEIEESTTTTVEVVAAAAAAAESGVVKQDYNSYKLTELRSLAKARGLRGYSKLKKGELVELLASLDS